MSVLYKFGPLPILSGRIATIIVSWVKSLTEVSVDVAVIVFFYWVLIVPQILSYLISGIFGCASPPLFVSKITTLVAWFLIKSLAACAGALTSFSIFSLYGKPYELPRDAPKFLIAGLFAMSMSFVSMMLYYKTEDVLHFIIHDRHLRLAAAVHDFLTRWKKRD